jgi:hypothetical protein
MRAPTQLEGRPQIETELRAYADCVSTRPTDVEAPRSQPQAVTSIEWRSQHGQNKPDQRDHGGKLCRFFARQARIGFGTDRRSLGRNMTAPPVSPTTDSLPVAILPRIDPNAPNLNGAVRIFRLFAVASSHAVGAEKLIRLFVFGCCHLLSRWCVTTKTPCRTKYGWTNLSCFSIAQ